VSVPEHRDGELQQAAYCCQCQMLLKPQGPWRKLVFTGSYDYLAENLILFNIHRVQKVKMIKTVILQRFPTDLLVECLEQTTLKLS
jgi:hypothetical protein